MTWHRQAHAQSGHRSYLVSARFSMRPPMENVRAVGSFPVKHIPHPSLNLLPSGGRKQKFRCAQFAAVATISIYGSHALPTTCASLGDLSYIMALESTCASKEGLNVSLVLLVTRPIHQLVIRTSGFLRASTAIWLEDTVSSAEIHQAFRSPTLFRPRIWSIFQKMLCRSPRSGAAERR